MQYIIKDLSYSQLCYLQEYLRALPRDKYLIYENTGIGLSHFVRIGGEGLLDEDITLYIDKSRISAYSVYIKTNLNVVDMKPLFDYVGGLKWKVYGIMQRENYISFFDLIKDIKLSLIC